MRCSPLLPPGPQQTHGAWERSLAGPSRTPSSCCSGCARGGFPAQLGPSTRAPGWGAQGAPGRLPGAETSQRFTGASRVIKSAHLPPQKHPKYLPLTTPGARDNHYGSGTTTGSPAASPKRHTCGASGGCLAPGLFQSPGSQSPPPLPRGQGEASCVAAMPEPLPC